MNIKIKENQPGMLLRMHTRESISAYLLVAACAAIVVGGIVVIVKTLLMTGSVPEGIGAIVMVFIVAAFTCDSAFKSQWRTVVRAGSGISIRRGFRSWNIPWEKINKAWLTYDESTYRGGVLYSANLYVETPLPEKKRHEIINGIALVMEWCEDSWGEKESETWYRIREALIAMGIWYEGEGQS